MLIEEAFKTYLLSDIAINNALNDTLYPMKVGKNPTYPVAVYHRISTVRDRDLQGNDGRLKSRIQLTIWDKKYKNAKELAESIKVLMNINNQDFGGIKVGIVDTASEQDVHDNKAELFGVMFDFIISYKE